MLVGERIRSAFYRLAIGEIPTACHPLSSPLLDDMKELVECPPRRVEEFIGAHVHINRARARRRIWATNPLQARNRRAKSVGIHVDGKVDDLDVLGTPFAEDDFECGSDVSRDFIARPQPGPRLPDDLIKDIWALEIAIAAALALRALHCGWRSQHQVYRPKYTGTLMQQMLDRPIAFCAVLQGLLSSSIIHLGTAT